MPWTRTHLRSLWTSTDYTTDEEEYEEVKVEDSQGMATMSEELDARVPCTAPVAKEEEYKPRLFGGYEVRPPPGPPKDTCPG